MFKLLIFVFRKTKIIRKKFAIVLVTNCFQYYVICRLFSQINLAKILCYKIKMFVISALSFFIKAIILFHEKNTTIERKNLGIIYHIWKFGLKEKSKTVIFLQYFSSVSIKLKMKSEYSNYLFFVKTHIGWMHQRVFPRFWHGFDMVNILPSSCKNEMIIS